MRLNLIGLISVLMYFVIGQQVVGGQWSVPYHHHHRIHRQYHSNSNFLATNENSGYKNSWSSGSNYQRNTINSNDLPDCPPEQMEEELEFGNEAYYTKARPNELKNCKPIEEAFPVPPYKTRSAEKPYTTHGQQNFQKLNYAPTRQPYETQPQRTFSPYYTPVTLPSSYDDETQPKRTFSPYYTPVTQPSYTQTPPTVTFSSYFRPYSTSSSYIPPDNDYQPTQAPYKPPAVTLSTYFRPTQAPYIPPETPDTSENDYKPTQAPYKPPAVTLSSYFRPTQAPYIPPETSDTSENDYKPTQALYKPPAVTLSSYFRPTQAPYIPPETPDTSENDYKPTQVPYKPPAVTFSSYFRPIKTPSPYIPPPTEATSNSYYKSTNAPYNPTTHVTTESTYISTIKYGSYQNPSIKSEGTKRQESYNIPQVQPTKSTFYKTTLTPNENDEDYKSTPKNPTTTLKFKENESTNQDSSPPPYGPPTRDDDYEVDVNLQPETKAQVQSGTASRNVFLSKLIPITTTLLVFTIFV